MKQTVPPLGIYQAGEAGPRVAVIESFGDDDDPAFFEENYWVTLRRISELGQWRGEEVELDRVHWEAFARDEELHRVDALPSILTE